MKKILAMTALYLGCLGSAQATNWLMFSAPQDTNTERFSVNMPQETNTCILHPSTSEPIQVERNATIMVSGNLPTSSWILEHCAGNLRYNIKLTYASDRGISSTSNVEFKMNYFRTDSGRLRLAYHWNIEDSKYVHVYCSRKTTQSGSEPKCIVPAGYPEGINEFPYITPVISVTALPESIS